MDTQRNSCFFYLVDCYNCSYFKKPKIRNKISIHAKSYLRKFKSQPINFSIKFKDNTILIVYNIRHF